MPHRSKPGRNRGNPTWFRTAKSQENNMKPRTNNPGTKPRSRWSRRQPQLGETGVETDPGVDRYLNTPFGRGFVETCLRAAHRGDWGLISSSESAANQLATSHGGQIIAAYLFPDAIEEEQLLLVDIINPGTTRSTTILRVLDEAVAA